MLYLLAAGTALAQDHQVADQTGAALSVGAGWMWVDPEENIDSTWDLVPRLGYEVANHWILEAVVGIGQGKTRSFGYGFDVYTPRVAVLFLLLADKPVEPFFAGEFGAIYKHVRRDPGVYEEHAPEGTNLGNFKNPDTDMLVAGGVGAFIHLGGPVHLRLDLRAMQNIGSEPHGEVQDEFTNFEALGGISFRQSELKRDTDGDGLLDRFDGCPTDPEDWDRFEDEDGCPDVDNDGDGIVDDDDQCPDVEEDFDEYRDRDGCPDEDNDSDGFVDWKDRCPDEPEDNDGFQDRDGCPDLDNDEDGIPDLEDRCPMDPEDVDGFQDRDGCPDEDNDRDTIRDSEDACPNDPETFNAFEDADGCPDTPPPSPKEIERFTGVIHGINFKVDSAEITVESYHILDEAAAVLARYPGVRIEVQGHTDSDASDVYNFELSDKRARSVVEYLVRRGIDPRRLQWIGYGESRPLVEGNTPDAKAVNRRVEFHQVHDDTSGSVHAEDEGL